jgi:hypothetical protein
MWNGVIAGAVMICRESSSLPTRRWREPDSNPRSPSATVNSGAVGEKPRAPRQPARMGERETCYQVPATIRCVTESRGGVRKVW